MKSIKKITALVLSLLLVLLISACAPKPQEKTLVVGASPSPHAQILELVKPILAEQGIALEIKEFTDYVLPNQALESGELDANYFQHFPYLQYFNENYDTTLVSAGSIHFEPLGLYAGKSSDITAVPDGATISVPNDVSNEARALQLLAQLGVITLTEGVGLDATIHDIVENPHNIDIVEIEAAQVPRTLADVDFAIANGNYALEAQITDKLLVSEDKDADGAQTYANVVAIKAGDEDREDIKALVEALKSQQVRDFIAETYGETVVPVN